MSTDLINVASDICGGCGGPIFRCSSCGATGCPDCELIDCPAFAECRPEPPERTPNTREGNER
jgi:uncharacterized Zn finger protein (UPF0148 family)